MKSFNCPQEKALHAGTREFRKSTRLSQSFGGKFGGKFG